MTKEEFLSLKKGESVFYCGSSYTIFDLHPRCNTIVLFQKCYRRKKGFHNMEVKYTFCNRFGSSVG